MFTVIYGYTFPSLQLVQRFAGELTVARKFTHREVHVAIACLVGQAFALQGVDHGQHLRHIVHGARLQRGTLNTQCIGVLVQGFDHAVSQSTNGFTVF